MQNEGFEHTDIQQESTIFLLVDNVRIQDLVVQGPGFLIGSRHEGQRRISKRERRELSVETNKQIRHRLNLFVSSPTVLKGVYLGNLGKYRDTLGNILTLFKTAMSQRDHRGASPISAGQRPISGWQLDDFDAPQFLGPRHRWLRA